MNQIAPEPGPETYRAVPPYLGGASAAPVTGQLPTRQAMPYGQPPLAGSPGQLPTRRSMGAAPAPLGSPIAAPAPGAPPAPLTAGAFASAAPAPVYPPAPVQTYASQPAAPAAPPTQPAAPSAAARGGRVPERSARIGLAQVAQEGDVDLDAALRAMIESGGSDLHLTSGAQPMIRLDGGLRPLEGFPVMYAEALQRTLYGILSQKQREVFEDALELDFAYAVRGVSRFRVNYYKQRDSVGAAFRMIPYEIKPLEELGVPPVVANFAGLPRGLVLVTGPTGSGKSTTLAAIIDLANRSRSDHIMTVEDPIEFLHRHKKSLINQREVGADTHSFANALKHVLRQDPDIILVGEMRDLETISVALTAAETGHLVFATLHTQDAAQTIDRIIDVFPAFQQEQVRTQLASALQGVVCQTLCKKANGKGRAVATEVMLATPAIRNLVREGKTHQIYSAMQAGAGQGMHTMDQHLAELVRAGRITYEVGLEKCHHVEDYNRLVGRTSRMTQGAGGMAGPMNASTAGAPGGSAVLR
ncbi:type IV pilus twitching motility protein PilT [Actinotalea sp.]|uniref:type IV pilus twitching motility protein PilT n=1 Tax=Actinotalea sp. TaxID=1872145 RepID=UPI002CF933EC|nr:type IV pilus twitching motility protein PilT [Actinotalea sp.]HQY33856.1 type IV pilus twitching motility protein PilT [Actinotalea sp.]HRA50023.1 type IV pilus twitching motility protein PilT [Actinotalea sp.]